MSVTALPVPVARAQAPLTVDDAAVTERHRRHVELFVQAAKLPVRVRPATAQHTTVLAFAYGVGPRVEVGFDVPLIVLVRSGDATAGGGDLNLTAKWVVREPTDSTATRLAVSGAIELPTGNAARGFGSGVADYDVNFVAEWPHSVGGTLRANAGIQFAGNTLTGLVGIPDRGVVVSAGGSGTWSIDSRASIGLEVTGYQGRSRIAADRELRAQGALVLLVTDDAAVAVSLQRGWFASPLLLAQLGCVLDF